MTGGRHAAGGDPIRFRPPPHVRHAAGRHTPDALAEADTVVLPVVPPSARRARTRRPAGRARTVGITVLIGVVAFLLGFGGTMLVGTVVGP